MRCSDAFFVAVDTKYVRIDRRFTDTKYLETAVTSITLDMDTGRQVRIEAGKSN